MISWRFVLDRLSPQVWWKPLKWHLDHITLNTSIQTHANEFSLSSSQPSLWSQRGWLFTSLLQWHLATTSPPRSLFGAWYRPVCKYVRTMSGGLVEDLVSGLMQRKWYSHCGWSQERQREISYLWVQVEQGEKHRVRRRRSGGQLDQMTSTSLYCFFGCCECTCMWSGWMVGYRVFHLLKFLSLS